MLRRQKRSEVRIGRYDHTSFLFSSREDRFVFGALEMVITDVHRIMSVFFEGAPRKEGIRRCRSGTSRSQRQFALSDRLGGILKRLADISRLEVWVGRQDLCFGHPVSNHAHDRSDWNAKGANARNPSHLGGINRDPMELHNFASSTS